MSGRDAFFRRIRAAQRSDDRWRGRPFARPSPDPAQEKIEGIAKAMIAASTDDDRRRLLAAAPPELARDERLRRRFHYLTGNLIYAGEYDRARALHLFSRTWCEQYHDLKGVMLEEWGEGNIEGFRGNNRAALEKFDAARRFFAETGDTKDEASVLLGSSIVYLRLGDYRQALSRVERALSIHRPTGDRELITNDLHTIGTIYNEQGQPERAAGYFEQALAEAGDDEEWQMYLFHSMGESRAAQGDLPGAIALTEKSLALARKLKERAREANVQTSLGHYLVEVGRLDEAEKLYREALSEAETLAEPQRQTVALIGLGDILARRAKDPAVASEALSMAERASTLARQTGDPLNIWQARTLAGRLLRLAGRGQEARTALEEAITAIEDSRGCLTGGDVEATAFFEDKLAPYQEMVASFVGEDRPAEALMFAERAKARVLLEILRGPKTNFEETLTTSEREALKKCGEQIAALNREWAAAPASDRGKVEGRLRQARLVREAAEEDALSAHPEIRRTIPSQGRDVLGLTLEEIGSLLGGADGKEALLEYVVCQDETFAFVVRRIKGIATPEIRVFKLPFGQTALASRTKHYRRTLAVRGLGWMAEARALGEDLLRKIRPLLTETEHLVIVPDDPLWELPFQTLPLAHGQGVLRATDTLTSRRLAFTPSLGFLLQTRGKDAVSAATPSQLRLLAFGNPAVGRTASAQVELAKIGVSSGTLRGDELLPLPDAEREVQALKELYGPEHCRVFVVEEAREATFRREASAPYDVIHFATHGIYNDRAPLYSRLLLSQMNLEAEEDGLLEAWELMRLPLRARLVVLSACETARGKVGAGEGVIGLSWALFTVGCPSCVVSHWKVDSKSNTALMVEFHRQLRAGVSKAESLQRASLALAAQPEYQHPFYWAPFVLIGESN